MVDAVQPLARFGQLLLVADVLLHFDGVALQAINAFNQMLLFDHKRFVLRLQRGRICLVLKVKIVLGRQISLIGVDTRQTH